MKKRWMKSIIETSKTAPKDLPFTRQVRHAARKSPTQTTLRSA